jgi:hypothetical protein
LLRNLLFGQDPRAVAQPGEGLPWGSLIHFFQGVRLLGQGLLLFYLATRTDAGAAAAAADPAWARYLMESQYDATARELLARYGVGDFNQPAGLQALGAEPGTGYQRLVTPFGRVVRTADGQPVVLVPAALLRPGSALRGYLLRLLLEFHLRRYYAQVRSETGSSRAAAGNVWTIAGHRVWMLLAPAGYLISRLGTDNSLLARQLKTGGTLSGAYRVWARFPTEQNGRNLLAGMVNLVRSQGTWAERQASARTLVILLGSMPAWNSTRVGTWQAVGAATGADVLFPLWLLDSGTRVLPGRLLDILETLPINLEQQLLAPLRRPELKIDQAV